MATRREVPGRIGGRVVSTLVARQYAVTVALQQLTLCELEHNKLALELVRKQTEATRVAKLAVAQSHERYQQIVSSIQSEYNIDLTDYTFDDDTGYLVRHQGDDLDAS